MFKTAITLTILFFIYGVSINVKHEVDVFKENQKFSREVSSRIKKLKQEIYKEKLLHKIVELESNYDHNKVGDLDYKYQAFGVAQFQERTFNWLSEKANFNGDLLNANDQIRLLRWSLDNGYGYLWSTFERAKKEIRI